MTELALQRTERIPKPCGVRVRSLYQVTPHILERRPAPLGDFTSRGLRTAIEAANEQMIKLVLHQAGADVSLIDE
jgi:hypothetical protein